MNNDELMPPAERDDFTQLLYGDIANTIANPKHPAGLALLVHGHNTGDTQGVLLLATTFLIRKYSDLLSLHFGSQDEALAYVNRMTAYSTLKRIEQEGDEE